jgi:hypothetical protein
VNDGLRPLQEGARRLRRPFAIAEREVREQIAAWATGEPPAEVEEVLVWAEIDQPSNQLLRDYCKRLGFKVGEFDAGLRRRKAEDELGRMPLDAADYVGLLAGKRGLSVLANGVIERDERSYVDIDFGDGEIHRSWTPPDETCEIALAHRDHWFRVAPTLSQFALDARVTAERLRLPFRRDTLNDAVQAWHQRAKHTRLEDIKHRIM